MLSDVFMYSTICKYDNIAIHPTSKIQTYIKYQMFDVKEDTVKNRNLDQITSLKLQAPMSVNRLCMLGTYVPNLVELDLSDSFLPSFRLFPQQIN